MGEVEFTSASLYQMKASQIKALCSTTPGIQGASRKSKPELIKEILTKLPEANQQTKRKFADGDMPAAKRALLSPVGKNSEILDFYNDHYGWLDQIDKDFYKVCNSTYNRTWGKTFGWALIILFIWNVWAIYEECLHMQLHKQHNFSKSPKMKKTWNRLILYIGEVCKQTQKFK